MKFRQLFVLLALLICAGSVRANSDALLTRLQPQGYVSDFAGVLPATQRAELETFLADLDRQTGVEIAVVAVPSLDGGEVDDFTNRLFQKWRIGKKGKDNGVMILAAIQDRKARIEVGYGLESVLPDAVAGRILREQMFPLFKQGRYADGLATAAQEVARIASGEASAPVATKPMGLADHFSSALSWIFFVGWFVWFLGWLVFMPNGRGRGLPNGRGRVYYSSVSFAGRGGGCSSSGGFSGGGGGFGGGCSGGGGASGGW